MDVVTLSAAKADTTKRLALAAKGGGLICAMGDSITANGYTTASGTHGDFYNAVSYLMQAVLQSGGKLQHAGVFGTAGYTTTQVMNTHLPQVLALAVKPQFCIVHAGTNNASGTTGFNTAVSDLTYIYQQLLLAGITPVLTTMLPSNIELGSARAAHLGLLSHWVRQYARDHGLPCVEWGSRMQTYGNSSWDGTSNSDNVHPNSTGAKTMGAAVAAALAPYLPPASPPVALELWQPSGLHPGAQNALLTNDTNTNGRPDWMDNTTGATGATYSLTAMSASEGAGNWYNVTATTAGSPFVYADPSTMPAVGHKVRFACKLKTSGMRAAGANFSLVAKDYAGSVGSPLAGLVSYDQDVPGPAVFAQDFVIPSGVGTQIHIALSMTAASSGSYTVSIGQVAFMDLTAAGLA